MSSTPELDGRWPLHRSSLTDGEHLLAHHQAAAGAHAHGLQIRQHLWGGCVEPREGAQVRRRPRRSAAALGSWAGMQGCMGQALEGLERESRLTSGGASSCRTATSLAGSPAERVGVCTAQQVGWGSCCRRRGAGAALRHGKAPSSNPCSRTAAVGARTGQDARGVGGPVDERHAHLQRSGGGAASSTRSRQGRSAWVAWAAPTQDDIAGTTGGAQQSRSHTSAAPLMTWKFVTMWPSTSHTKPLPCAGRGRKEGTRPCVSAPGS